MDMGFGTVTGVGMEQVHMTIDGGVKNLVGLFDGASREKSGHSRFQPPPATPQSTVVQV
jgi:hypothetical protein